MKDRYIVALIPPSSIYKIYQSYAQECFTPICNDYLLGENSLPHITLGQFESDDLQQVQAIKEACLALNFYDFKPTFLGLCILNDRKVSIDSYWFQLLVLREESLVKVHQHVVKIIERFDLQCINKHGELYRPHLSLAHVRLPTPYTFHKWPDELVGQSSNIFSVALGRGDSYGQFIKVL